MPAVKSRKRTKSKAATKPAKTFCRFDKKLGRVIEYVVKYDAAKGCNVEVEVTAPAKKKAGVPDWLQPRSLGRNPRVNVWPMTPHSLTLHKKQIPEMQKLLAKKGVRPTDFDKHGRPILRDRAHRTEYYRATGRCDLNAGIRDPEPLRYRGEPRD